MVSVSFGPAATKAEEALENRSAFREKRRQLLRNIRRHGAEIEWWPSFQQPRAY